eukprot:364168-Chlamydomonas_euryale.AAC.1
MRSHVPVSAVVAGPQQAAWMPTITITTTINTNANTIWNSANTTTTTTTTTSTTTNNNNACRSDPSECPPVPRPGRTTLLTAWQRCQRRTRRGCVRCSRSPQTRLQVSLASLMKSRSAACRRACAGCVRGMLCCQVRAHRVA